MNSPGADFILLCHSLALGVTAVLALHVCCAWRGGVRGLLLMSWMVSTALWALSNVALLQWGSSFALPAALMDVTRALLAMALLIALMGGVRAARGLSAMTLLVGLIAVLGVAAVGFGGASWRALANIELGLAVIGLVAVEHFWRRLPAMSRWAAKPLCLALCALFAFDVYAHGEAALLGRMTADMWAARSVVAALCMPLVWLFAARAKEASVAVSLSHRAVFHSTALAASGAYLMLMSAAGFYVRDYGGKWGPALQSMLVFALVLLFVVLASSAGVRAKSRLLLARHCFKLRYDYRQIWLGLTQRLSTAEGFSDSGERVVAGLCELVESPSGVLWWANEAGDFEARAAHNLPLPDLIEPAGSVLAAERTVWLCEQADTAPLQALAHIPRAWLVVPLVRASLVKGFVVLSAPPTRVELDWEVRDALTTTAAQAVTDLCHWQAIDALMAARKFETTSRFATFAMHDLKNCVAELSLVVSNAARHGDKPEFRQDMLHSLHHVATRMQGLIDSMKAGLIDSTRNVDVAPMLEDLTAEMALHTPAPQLELRGNAIVRADLTRLKRVIGHLLQNAIDATDANGRVWINLARDGEQILIEIHDTGAGMSQDFVRDRLFKPFQTTKAQGMGIGAYEAQQYIRTLGGRIEVASTLGRGTTLTVRLPAVEQCVDRQRVAA